MYGEGISLVGDLLDVATDKNIVEKSGSWYSYNGERIGQGRENTKAFLRDHAETLAVLDTTVRQALGLAAAAPVVAAPEVPEPSKVPGRGVKG
jgi:recombination protein RecA